MANQPAFDEIHCISDLHLGGKTGFQIFGSTQELADLIGLLTSTSPAKQLALVINGDFIDFLAEEPSTHFDPQGAITKLDRIVTTDPAFKPVFDALRAFVATPLRTLVINLGNHDLELALPWVRTHLIDLIAHNDATARGRIHTIADGTGFACTVGQASVLCIHGNEVDNWNPADFDHIRRMGRDLQYGRPVDAWIPNAGTQMVIDVMNDIKKKYPFVDLLKPEKEAVVPILLALNPDALPKLRAIGAVVNRLAFDSIRGRLGFLGDVEPVDGNGPSAPASSADRPDPRMASSAVDLLDMVEQEARLNTDPMDLVRAKQAEQLGFWSAVGALIQGKSTAEALREALDGLDKDRSFDFATPDATFKAIDELVAPNIDFVVAGHTHLERALKRTAGPGWYFNSGTWARLIQITADVRKDAKRFAQLVDVFKDGVMSKLDAQPGLVIKRCTVVSIWADGAQVHGQLRRMSSGQPGQPKKPQLVPVEGTLFTKGA